MDKERIEDVPAPVASSDWKSMLWLGVGVIVFTFVGLGGWSAVARIDSAVVAGGMVSVESYRKTVQHLEGGIVQEIMVRDGDAVQEGQVLLRLDPTRSGAAEKILRQQLAVTLALEARLIAQRGLADAVVFPDEVAKAGGDPLVANAMQDNRRQFEARRGSLLQATEVIEKLIAQARKEVEQSITDQKTASDQLQSIGQELPNLRSLLERGLVALPRVTTLERQEMATRGALQTAKINHDKAREKIAELEARREQLRQEYRQEAANALPDVRKSLGDLVQQIVVASDATKRVEVKAPVSGTVQQLRIFTVGGVLKPGDPILDIVPASDTLVVRAKVSSTEVDRIVVGMPVEIRVPQFTQYQIHPIGGSVRSISRDSIVDEVTRQPYFAVEVAVERASIPREIEDKLSAGMVVDALIRTEERTVLQFLLSPLVNRLASSLRER
ncbi:HlyD family type I secretion periplasmic adaptor subunit [Rhodoplanes sp. TEM]|uniref:Membrane fusion protein (MFP) family protein n=1 Tax=Rhodoplanes tepidamans TaxID=200616 RepID=A0ABT5JAT1_RHOTP|nr:MULTISPECIES: HlyD family type I secretion periplasmic adaptor subunit [Rhodoplanes]MDC7786702.1 HlyD family type I secretion periplasmic adaptor subunit [Rhodoplanes tepidamans]MDC7983708.1 HlyD family type I secretion periplasmic adaptor subunit [Rhodoplanes sp. TEM]MDQ0358138.1 HlyD family type I secretion membrane fusion protein [Rhodoplanes tepidamans]